MLAREVMSANPIVVSATMPIEDCARLLLEKRISAMPVVDAAGVVIGIVSEGDLIRRPAPESEARRRCYDAAAPH
jgi:CBS domain-containing protein